MAAMRRRPHLVSQVSHVSLLSLVLVFLAAAPAAAQAGASSEETRAGGETRQIDAAVGEALAALDERVAQIRARLDGPERPDDPAWVAKKLEVMRDADQAIRNSLFEIPAGIEGEAAQAAWREGVTARMGAADEAHTAELAALIDRHGWFRISVFGEEADADAWLLVQHADRDVAFQKRVLALLEPLVEMEETSPSHYAYLWDRVAMNEERPQRYGTQGRCTGPGTWEPFEIEDPERVDERRAATGLQPLDEYAKLFAERGYCP